jgi:hypothetical protein
MPKQKVTLKELQEKEISLCLSKFGTKAALTAKIRKAEKERVQEKDRVDIESDIDFNLALNDEDMIMDIVMDNLNREVEMERMFISPEKNSTSLSESFESVNIESKKRTRVVSTFFLHSEYETRERALVVIKEHLE